MINLKRSIFEIVHLKGEKYNFRTGHWHEEDDGTIVFNVKITPTQFLEKVAEREGLKVGYEEYIPEDDVKPIDTYHYIELRVKPTATEEEIEQGFKKIRDIIKESEEIKRKVREAREEFERPLIEKIQKIYNEAGIS